MRMVRWIMQEGRRRCDENAVARGAVQSTRGLKAGRAQSRAFCLGLALNCPARRGYEGLFLLIDV